MPIVHNIRWDNFAQIVNPNEIDTVLHNIANQTGLTFTHENRPVRILFAERTNSMDI